MFKKLMLFWATLFLMSSFASAEEKFAVQGEVVFPNKADIYIELKTEDEHERDKAASEARCLVIKLSEEQKRTKRVPFKFVGVPKGTYCILSFQDIDGNGKLDFSLPSWSAGRTEPHYIYKPGWPSVWENVKFDIDKDITGIKLDLRKGSAIH